MPKVLFPTISPNALIRLYAGSNSGPVATRDLLAFHLREGNIRTRAWNTWLSNEVSLREAWKSGPAPENSLARPRKISSDRNVKSSLWWDSKNWAHDVDQWQFRKNRFTITLCERPLSRLMLKGLRFHGGDVKACFDPRSRDESRRSPGRTTDRDQWRLFWYEIIKLIQDGSKDFGVLGLESNEKVGSRVINKLTSTFERDDEQLVADVERSAPFKLKEEVVREEVKALRRKFNLSRGTPASSR